MKKLLFEVLKPSKDKQFLDFKLKKGEQFLDFGCKAKDENEFTLIGHKREFKLL